MYNMSKTKLKGLPLSPIAHQAIGTKAFLNGKLIECYISSYSHSFIV